MADIDWGSLMQNPLFMAGVQGLLANPQQRGQAMLQGAQAAQTMAGQSQLQQMRALQLQQAQNAANFNPNDYMQTTPNAGTATPDMQAQQQQQPAMPSTLGGALGGGALPMLQPSLQAIQNTPIPQPTPGTSTGHVDYPSLLQAGMQAGMQPSEVQGLAQIMDPATAARLSLMSKFEKLGPQEVGVNGLGQEIARNDAYPASSPVGQINALTTARDNAIKSGNTALAQTLDDAIQKASGSAEQSYREHMMGNSDQRLALEKAYRQGDPRAIETTAQAIANNQLAPLAGFAMRTPQGQAVMARVMEINPQYDAKNYAASQKSVNDFATGKNGNTVRSLNVAINHLDTLNELSDALGNGNVQMVNQLGNAIGKQTGKPAVTNFDSARTIVADEIVKAIVGSGGGVKDREDAQNAVNNANSPAQLQGVIQTYQKLLGGQLSGLQQQYEQSTGRKDFDRFLSPTTQSVIGGGPRKTVVRTGTANGRKVIQYSDGTTAYAD